MIAAASVAMRLLATNVARDTRETDHLCGSWLVCVLAGSWVGVGARTMVLLMVMKLIDMRETDQLGGGWLMKKGRVSGLKGGWDMCARWERGGDQAYCSTCTAALLHLMLQPPWLLEALQRRAWSRRVWLPPTPALVLRVVLLLDVVVLLGLVPLGSLIGCPRVVFPDAVFSTAVGGCLGLCGVAPLSTLSFCL